jgi:hypothetical protein
MPTTWKVAWGIAALAWPSAIGAHVAAAQEEKAPPAGSTASDTRTNTLGMKFVRLPGTDVFMSIWETRVKDYQPFARATATPWKPAEFSQGPDHPAVNVNWESAARFCQWLTGKEQDAGKLPKNMEYRLPTGVEWSLAAGLPPSNAVTARPGALPVAYPWGETWPPPKDSGNYAPDLAVDPFRHTAPAGSFKPNALGIYDLGGNVWEWCADTYSDSPDLRALRGASWRMGRPAMLNLYHVVGNLSELELPTYGFRCALAPVGVVSVPAQIQSASAPAPPSATGDAKPVDPGDTGSRIISPQPTQSNPAASAPAPAPSSG